MPAGVVFKRSRNRGANTSLNAKKLTPAKNSLRYADLSNDRSMQMTGGTNGTDGAFSGTTESFQQKRQQANSSLGLRWP
jgi:hypothetical protein